MYASLLQKIPILLVCIVLVIAVWKLYVYSKGVTKGEFWKMLKKAKYFSIWVIIISMIFTGVFGIFHYIKSKQFVMAVVSLNYSEASQAKNSNGTRYNMSEILCDEVIEKAIEMGAFENVTPKQLKECLSVYPYVQGDVDDKSNYHISTEFVVEYTASKDTQHLKPENVIQMVTGAYKEYYIDKYTDNLKYVWDKDRPNYSEMEYMDIVAYLNKKATTILNYLYGMAEKGPSFVTKDNTTFLSIAGKVYQYKETQIEENLHALILQYGIAKDREGYIDRLTHQNENTDFERRKNAVSYDLCNRAVEIYAEEMTRIVLVPTWDEGGKYYMGRTKVGIDELSVQATSYSDKVASNEKSIMENELVIDKMEAKTNRSSAEETAAELIVEIDENIGKFMEEALRAGKEYSYYRMNQCVAVSFSGESLFSKLKTVCMFAVLAYIAFTAYSISRKLPKA